MAEKNINELKDSNKNKNDLKWNKGNILKKKSKQHLYTHEHIYIYTHSIHFKETTKIVQAIVQKAAQEIKIESSKTSIKKTPKARKRGKE